MKYKIGDKFTIGASKTVYVIVDIIYSTKYKKWKYEYYYRNNVFDEGYCSDWCNYFDKLKSVKLVQYDNN